MPVYFDKIMEMMAEPPDEARDLKMKPKPTPSSTPPENTGKQHIFNQGGITNRAKVGY